MRHLVIGKGQIGSALAEVLKCDSCDKEGVEGHYEVIHICFPYSPDFALQVNQYKDKHSAKYVVVHSTVPVGTCRSMGVIHSPVTGVHPHLVDSIKRFRKPLGGFGAVEIAKEFRNRGLLPEVWSSSDATEASKLFALLIYGINIMLEKEIYDYCAEKQIDFNDVYCRMVSLYNNGYKAMGLSQYQMYELKHKDGSLGGHCVSQNAPMLGTFFSKILATLDAELRGKM